MGKGKTDLGPQFSGNKRVSIGSLWLRSNGLNIIS